MAGFSKEAERSTIYSFCGVLYKDPVQRQLFLGRFLYLCMVDFSKAFDLVSRHILCTITTILYKLMKQGYHGRVIDTLRSLYRMVCWVRRFTINLVSTRGGNASSTPFPNIFGRSWWLFGEACWSLYIRNHHGSSVVGRRFDPYLG